MTAHRSLTTTGPSGLTRRALLRRGGLAAGTLALPGLLAACGSDPGPGPQERATTARSIGVDYASFYAPVASLRTLITARAQARGAAVTFSDDASGTAAQQATLKRWLDPDKGFRAVVVAPFQAAALRPAVQRATGKGIHVVSYVAPLPGSTASVVVDPEQAGAQLAANVAAWTRRAGTANGGVLLVRPSTGAPIPDPFVPLAAPAERALTAALARDAPTLRTVAAVEGLAVDDTAAAVTAALRVHPAVRTVLCWSDATAVGAATALRAHAPAADRDDLYVGAVAIAGPTGTGVLRALEASASAVRCIVAPSRRSLAGAVVDLPLGLLRGRPAADVRVPTTTLVAGAPGVRQAIADLA